jgi:phosphatidylglycerol:prolipoprotein diacylglycerol transferase
VLPDLFHAGRFPVPTHDAFTLLGLCVALAVFVVDARRAGVAKDPRLWWVAYGALLGGALGAKVATVWRYLADVEDPALLGALVDGGKSVVGGLAGAYVGALVAKRLAGYRRPTGDLFAPAVAIGIAIGRIGCFLTEQPGTPTTLPWGIRLDADTIDRIRGCHDCVSGVPLHPSFLYEIAFLIGAFVALRRLRSRMPVEGQSFKVFLLAYGIFRFGVEFVRGNEATWNGLSGTQLFLIPSVLLLAAGFARTRRLGWRTSEVEVEVEVAGAYR